MILKLNENYGICCVCGHSLNSHIDEGDFYRCHSLGSDTYQCECRLIKHDDFCEDTFSIDYYDLGKRVDEVLKELGLHG